MRLPPILADEKQKVLAMLAKNDLVEQDVDYLIWHKKPIGDPVLVVIMKDGKAVPLCENP